MEKLVPCVYLWKQIILSLAIYTSQEVICKTLINILKRLGSQADLVFFVMISSETKLAIQDTFFCFNYCKIFLSEAATYYI